MKTHACVKNARVRFGALLPYIFKKHPRYNLPTESFRHGREKTSGRAFRILSFLSSLSQRIKIEPTKLCTTLSKHGALYPRTVGMPELPPKPSGFGGFTMPKVGFSRCAISLSNTFLTKGIMNHKRIKVSVKSTLVIG